MNYFLAFCVCLLIFASGCFELGTEPPEYRPPNQTEILDILVDPNPVVGQDTVKITCVIRDSLDTRFTFTWSSIDGEVIGFGKDLHRVSSKSNTILWVPPLVTQENDALIFITVDNGARDSSFVEREIDIKLLP